VQPCKDASTGARNGRLRGVRLQADLENKDCR
jgi:hypothetical protein